MIIRRANEVRELDVEKIVGVSGIKMTVKWMIDKNVGGEEYGHRFAVRYFTMAPGGEYPMHKHHYVEAVFLITGKLAFADQSGNWVEIGPGDVVYTARWEEHALKNVGQETAAFICCIDCEPEGEPCEAPMMDTATRG
jgi:quercetin dioxygenase-like cupin family protein